MAQPPVQFDPERAPTPDSAGPGETFIQPKIAGYRNLSPQELNGINMLKQQEATVLELLGFIQSADYSQHPELRPDMRWLSIARTHIEQGFMAAVRSIAKPQRVNLPESHT